jgi:electron transfer flavoprotein beta subunit
LFSLSRFWILRRQRFNMETERIDGTSASAEINPFDLNALEAAVGIKKKVGGYVTALSMVPMQKVR